MQKVGIVTDNPTGKGALSAGGTGRPERESVFVDK